MKKCKIKSNFNAIKRQFVVVGAISYRIKVVQCGLKTFCSQGINDAKKRAMNALKHYYHVAISHQKKKLNMHLSL